MMACDENISSDAIHTWIVFVTGFMQREGGATPFEKLHRRVTQICSGPSTIVALRSWRDSVKDFAQRISNWRNGKPPRVVVIGYSYGGWSANQLCKRLQGFDIAVDDLLLVDPVGRWFGSLPSACSMLNVIPLVVPENVRRLYSWQQTFDYPRGANITLAKEFSALQSNTDPINCGTQWITAVTKQHVPHVNMDDLSEIHFRAIDISCGRAA